MALTVTLAALAVPLVGEMGGDGRTGDLAVPYLRIFLALVLDSVAIAGQVIVGRSLGAGDAEEAYRAARRGCSPRTPR